MKNESFVAFESFIMYANELTWHFFRVIHSEDVISSPVAGSLVETDFEDDLQEPKDDVDVDNGPKTAGKAVSFMGQLTPGSSICNFKSRNSESSTWTK